MLALAPTQAADAAAGNADSGTPPPTFAAMPTGTARPRVDMSLREAISIALSDGFSAKLQDISLLNSRESYLRSRTEYLPTFNVGPTLSFGGQDPNVRTQTLGVTASVSQKTPIGATVSLSTNLINISRRSRQSPTYTGGLQLSVSGLNLMRLNPKYNLNSLRSAKVSFDNSFLSYKSQIMQIITSVESAYLSVLSSQEQLEIQRRSLQLSETTYNETNARFNVGTVTQINLLQAESTLLSARDNFSNTERSLIAAEDNLRTLLGGGAYDVGIHPSDPLEDYNGQVPDVQQAFDEALANGTDYQIAVQNLTNTEAAAYVAEVNARPNVTLGGSIGVNGSATDFSPAWDQVGRRDDYNWSVNLNASIPWPRRNEKSSARTAQNNLTSARIQLDQLRNQIYTNVRSQIRTITQNFQSVQLRQRQVEVQQQSYDAEYARYSQGLITYRDLQTAQNQLESARTSLLTSRISLRNALSNLSRIEGNTLERFGITVPTE